MMKLVRYALAGTEAVEHHLGDFVRLNDVRTLVDRLAMMSPGFGGIGSKEMKPFLEAGVLLEVFDRDFTIANNLRKTFAEVNP